jgi:uncharacterized protein (DUF58 family)
MARNSKPGSPVLHLIIIVVVLTKMFGLQAGFVALLALAIILLAARR